MNATQTVLEAMHYTVAWLLGFNAPQLRIIRSHNKCLNKCACDLISVCVCIYSFIYSILRTTAYGRVKYVLACDPL